MRYREFLGPSGPLFRRSMVLGAVMSAEVSAPLLTDSSGLTFRARSAFLLLTRYQ
jgi:hypothetical protein